MGRWVMPEPLCPACDGTGVSETVTRCCRVANQWCGCYGQPLVDRDPCSCLRVREVRSVQLSTLPKLARRWSDVGA